MEARFTLCSLTCLAMHGCPRRTSSPPQLAHLLKFGRLSHVSLLNVDYAKDADGRGKMTEGGLSVRVWPFALNAA
jgi:hypothetical protein